MNRPNEIPDKPIVLDDQNGSLISSLICLPNLRIKTKLDMIMDLDEKYRNMGQVIANIDKKFVEKKLTKSERRVISKLTRWADTNHR